MERDKQRERERERERERQGETNLNALRMTAIRVVNKREQT